MSRRVCLESVGCRRQAARWLIALGLIATSAAAAPLTQSEIVERCGNAEDSAHCGRLIEETQLRRLPGLAHREGDTLIVSLYPSGNASFVDSQDVVNGRSYSLWNYLDGVNAVVLYTTAGEETGFMLLQRASNRRIDLPAEPQLSPDRQRLVTTDVCATRCINEIALWRISKDGVRKELTWTPPATWTDASARWKDAETLVVEYSADGSSPSTTVERKISDPSWKRAGS